MSAPLFAILSVNSGVTALVGNRIYPAGMVPQEVAQRPVITYQTVGGSVFNTLTDDDQGDAERVQIDCWDYTLAGADAVLIAVRAALTPAVLQAAGIAGNCKAPNGHDFEAETKTYRVSFDFLFLS